MTSRSWSLWTMTIIVFVGFALGAAQLNADILWVDEMASVSAMGAVDPPLTIEEILDEIASRIPDHVPLYDLVGAGWAQAVGWSQVALRYLSLLFGVASIAWIYRFGAEVFDRRTALLAAFLFATHAMVLIYFHELRNYALWILLSVIHAWQYWRLASGRKASLARWAAFAATTSALLYTHPFSPFVLLGLGAHHLLLVKKNRRWGEIVFAWGVGVATFLPYLPRVLAGIGKATDSRSVQAEALSSIQLLPILANVLANGVDLLWLVLLVGAGWVLWQSRQRWKQKPSHPQRSVAFLRLLMIFATMGISLLVFHALDPFVSTRRLRYFLVALTFGVVLSAYILISLPRWQVVVPAFALAWLAGGFHIYQQAEHWKYAGHHSLLIPHPPLHRFADALQGLARPQDAILSFTQATFLNNGLYFGFSTVDYYSQAALGIHGAFIWTELTGDELRTEFDQRVGDHPYLLFTFEPGNLATNFAEVRALLEQDYVPCEILVDSEEVYSQRYALRALGCDRGYHEINYDNGVKIIDRYAVLDDEAKSLRVVTGWEVADKAQLEEYNVSVQIIAPDWQKAFQAPDRHLYDNILTWYAVEISIDELPPGEYTAMVILYDRYTLKKVSGVDVMTGQVSDIFAVTSFDVGA